MFILAATPLEASIDTFNVFLSKIENSKKISIFVILFFSWEGGGTIPQNSYKPSRAYEKLPCKGEPDRFSG